MELISVIVPVYKAEAYLDQCIASIVNQSYQNLEIILVDDGSPDGSGAICDAWAAKDSRIQVLHTENAGAGAARNVGTQMAAGEIFSYIDSDDYLAADMYEKLYARLLQTDSDIASCGILRVWPDRSELIRQGAEDRVLSRTEAMRAMIQTADIIMTPPNKLYRRHTVEDVPFPVGRTIDDEFWSWRVVANAQRVATLTEPLYFYRQHGESVMHSRSVYHLLDVVDAKCIRQEYINAHMPELKNEAAWNLLSTCLYQGQTMLRSFPYAQVKAQLAQLQKLTRENSVDRAFYRQLKLTRKLRYGMLRHCFVLLCRMQNLLHIGI